MLEHIEGLFSVGGGLRSSECLLVSEDLTCVSRRRLFHLTTIIFSTNKHVVTDHYFNFPRVLFWAFEIASISTSVPFHNVIPYQ